MRQSRSGYRRRGVVIPLVLVIFPLLLGFAALVIDVGRLYNTRTELQRAADAAVLAGVSAYVSDSALDQDLGGVTTLARSRSQTISKVNQTLKANTLLAQSDIALGRHDYENRNGPLLQGGGRWNAVEATVRRTPDGLNGGVDFFFARVFGIYHGSVQAKARAAVDDRFAGYDLRKNTHALLPFTIDEKLYEQLAATGADSYSYDTNSVNSSPDGVSEVRLFPWRLNQESGSDGEDGNGNFGTLNVGANGQGTAYLSMQIENGIPDNDLQLEFSATQLKFFDGSGAPQTYTATGNPGLSTGMSPAVNSRVGDIIGFFVHNSFVDNGSQIVYTITGLRFGRVMAVDLHGRIETRFISVQPAPYADSAIIVDPGAPSTNGEILKIALVQ